MPLTRMYTLNNGIGELTLSSNNSENLTYISSNLTITVKCKICTVFSVILTPELLN